MFAIETEGTVYSTDEVLDRAALERVFDTVAEALARLHDREADVAVNLDTARFEFFIVVDSNDPEQAFAIADDLINRALAAAEVGVAVRWDAGARRADLVPA